MENLFQKRHTSLDKISANQAMQNKILFSNHTHTQKKNMSMKRDVWQDKRLLNYSVQNGNKQEQSQENWYDN